MSFPPRKTGGGTGGGDNPGFNLNSRFASATIGNQYSLPIGGWTTVPLTIMSDGAGFTFDPVTHTMTIQENGYLIVNARVGVIPKLEETGRLRLTVMITKNGAPLVQGNNSALSYDVMCVASAMAMDYFVEGDEIEVHAIGDGDGWTEPFMLIQPDRSLNNLELAYLVPAVVV